MQYVVFCKCVQKYDTFATLVFWKFFVFFEIDNGYDMDIYYDFNPPPHMAFTVKLKP